MLKDKFFFSAAYILADVADYSLPGPYTFWIWGANFDEINSSGPSSGGILFPTQSGTDSDWSSVSGGYNHGLAVKINGTLWSFGKNFKGATGQGINTGTILSPLQVGSATDWFKVSAAKSELNPFSLAIKTDGTLWSWGSNANGATGQGTTTGELLVPTQVGTDTDWIDISTGISIEFPHALGLKSNGTLWSWGSNSVGATGQGTNTGNTTTPTQVGSATNWTEISAGRFHNLAVRSNGTLWSWGWNVDGITGQGTTTGELLVPTQVGSATDWQKVSAGRTHSIAIKSNGTLWSFGSNANGVTGQGTTTGNTTTPTQVGSISTWEKISAGNYHSLALRSNGTLWSWGWNDGGATGQGTTTGDTLVPSQIGSATNWQDIAAGVSFSYGLRS